MDIHFKSRKKITHILTAGLIASTIVVTSFTPTPVEASTASILGAAIGGWEAHAKLDKILHKYNDTEEGRAANRRIEISMILKDESVLKIVEQYLALELPEVGASPAPSASPGTNRG